MTTELETVEDKELMRPVMAEDIATVTNGLFKSVPRWVSRHADGIIQATTPIKAIADKDTRTIVQSYAANLQAEKKLIISHYSPYKKAFHEPHKSICAMENEALAPIDREVGRLKDMLAAFDGENETGQTELRAVVEDAALFFGACVTLPHLVRYLSINQKEIDKQLAKDGVHLQIPGVKVVEVAKRPAIRAEQL